MRFTRAALTVPTGIDSAETKEVVVLTTDNAASIGLNRIGGGWLRPNLEIVRRSASVADDDGLPAVVDAFDVYGGFVDVQANAIIVTGFGRGVCGRTRDGGPVMRYEDGAPMGPQEESEEFRPVRWVLT